MFEAKNRIQSRSLCPWEWRVNRDEEREPKLISEAVCLCRSARAIPGALCVPIRREFPVLKRVYCDRDRYVQLLSHHLSWVHSSLAPGSSTSEPSKRSQWAATR